MESSFNGARAVLLAAKYCNQYPLFEWREEALPSIGRRAEKYCFRVDMVNLLQDRCGEMVLTLFPVQQSFLDFQKENTLYKLKMLLVTLKVRCLFRVACGRDGNMVLGSIRICFQQSISSTPRRSRGY